MHKAFAPFRKIDIFHALPVFLDWNSAARSNLKKYIFNSESSRIPPAQGYRRSDYFSEYCNIKQWANSSTEKRRSTRCYPCICIHSLNINCTKRSHFAFLKMRAHYDWNVNFETHIHLIRTKAIFWNIFFKLPAIASSVSLDDWNLIFFNLLTFRFCVIAVTHLHWWFSQNETHWHKKITTGSFFSIHSALLLNYYIIYTINSLGHKNADDFLPPTHLPEK